MRQCEYDSCASPTFFYSDKYKQWLCPEHTANRCTPLEMLDGLNEIERNEAEIFQGIIRDLKSVVEVVRIAEGGKIE